MDGSRIDVASSTLRQRYRINSRPPSGKTIFARDTMYTCHFRRNARDKSSRFPEEAPGRATLRISENRSGTASVWSWWPLLPRDYLTRASRRYPASRCQEAAQAPRLLVLRTGCGAGLSGNRLGRLRLAGYGDLLFGDGDLFLAGLLNHRRFRHLASW